MTKKVIIIGAGLAGINAAHLLSENGYEIKLIESNSYIGGRCRSFVDKNTAEEIDNGQHLFMGAYKNFINLIKNISDLDYLQIINGINLSIINRSELNYLLYSKGFSGKLGMMIALMKINNVSVSSKLKIIKLFIKIPFINSNKVKSSASDFLLQNGQTNEIIRIFWEPLILAVLNTTPTNASAKLLINVLKKSFLSDEKSSKMILSKVGLSKYFENFESILKSKNSEIIYNTIIKSLIIENNNIIGVQTSNNEKYYADIIISAIPYYGLEKILNDDLYFSEFFKSLKFYKSSSIMSVYLWYNSEIISEDFFAMIDSNIQWVFNRRNFIISDNNSINKFKGHLTVTISDADRFNNMSKYEIIELITEDLEIAIPEIKNNQLMHYQIIKEKRATFTANKEIEQYRLKQITPYNSFYVIGDWTDTGLPATIEGACVSAVIAVNDILKHHYK